MQTIRVNFETIRAKVSRVAEDLKQTVEETKIVFGPGHPAADKEDPDDAAK